jgi:thiol-disulfide isomerase/thioredoxin
MPSLQLAPPLNTSDWLNAPDDFSLEAVKGKVVLLEAFQMLCPGCVSHGLPQAQRVANLFDSKDVAVIGLHTVFEHHAAQGHRAALDAFVHEYRFTFPIGIDMHDAAGVPQTMQAYRMQGTPTLILLDRFGRRRMQAFGRT